MAFTCLDSMTNNDNVPFPGTPKLPHGCAGVYSVTLGSYTRPSITCKTGTNHTCKQDQTLGHPELVAQLVATYL
jgi:hypothetical protein